MPILEAPQVIDSTKAPSPFRDVFGNPPEPGSWDALWDAKRTALRTDAQNKAVANAYEAGSGRRTAEASVMRAINEPLIAAEQNRSAAERAAAANAAHLEGIRLQGETQKAINAETVAERREAAKLQAESIRRQAMVQPMGQVLVESVSGIPVPLMQYGMVTVGEDGQPKLIPVGNAAKPRASVEQVHKEAKAALAANPANKQLINARLRAAGYPELP
jgi:hypothetical protein